MPISMFKIFILFGIVSRWADKALADGKITLPEAVDLVTAIAPVLGIPTDLDVSALLPDAFGPTIDVVSAGEDAETAPPPKIVPQE